jgi:hypothetical protein
VPKELGVTLLLQRSCTVQTRHIKINNPQIFTRILAETETVNILGSLFVCEEMDPSHPHTRKVFEISETKGSVLP